MLTSEQISPDLRRRLLQPLCGSGPQLLLPARTASRAAKVALATCLEAEICLRFRTRDWAARLRALRALIATCSRQDATSSFIAGAVMPLLDDDDGRVREAAANALPKLAAPSDATIIEAIAMRLERPCPFTRRAAVAALSMFSPNVAAAAATVRLAHSDACVRSAAVQALGNLLNQEPALDVTALQQCLRDSSAEVRHATLKAVRCHDAMPAIAELLRSDPEICVRQAAAASMARILPNVTNVVTFEALVAALEDTAWAVRKASAEALAIVVVPDNNQAAKRLKALNARAMSIEEHSLVRRAASEAVRVLSGSGKGT